MATLLNTLLKLKIWRDSRGQELIEYALIAAFMVTAWGAVSPAVASDVSTVFSKVSDSLSASAGASGQVQ
jgi:pilus assembly protein Flp/PilA